MSGRTLRAGIREELQRSAKNQDMFCSHVRKIQAAAIEGGRPDIAEKIEALGVMAVTLKDLAISLRETI